MMSSENLSRRQGFPPLTFTPEEIAYDNSPQILSITGTFFAAAAIVVLLRCYVRIRVLRVFGIDDWVMLGAMASLLPAFLLSRILTFQQAFCTATFACFVVRVHFGLGHHLMVLFLLIPENYVNFTKTQYTQAILMMVGLSLLKISIALTLLRLSVQRIYKRILWGSIIFISIMTGKRYVRGMQYDTNTDHCCSRMRRSTYFSMLTSSGCLGLYTSAATLGNWLRKMLFR
jgi:hypothetical protein